MVPFLGHLPTQGSNLISCISPNSAKGRFFNTVSRKAAIEALVQCVPLFLLSMLGFSCQYIRIMILSVLLSCHFSLTFRKTTRGYLVTIGSDSYQPFGLWPAGSSVHGFSGRSPWSRCYLAFSNPLKVFPNIQNKTSEFGRRRRLRWKNQY